MLSRMVQRFLVVILWSSILANTTQASVILQFDPLPQASNRVSYELFGVIDDGEFYDAFNLIVNEASVDGTAVTMDADFFARFSISGLPSRFVGNGTFSDVGLASISLADPVQDLGLSQADNAFALGILEINTTGLAEGTYNLVFQYEGRTTGGDFVEAFAKVQFNIPISGVVPEPASIAVWGILGLIGMRVRKRKS